MNTNMTILNALLEKKFEFFNTRENDRQDLRKIFETIDDKRKIEMIQNIDVILHKFNQIHEETLAKQIQVIDTGIQNILIELSHFIENQKTTDVLAELP